jgi:hypothetical protein
MAIGQGSSIETIGATSGSIVAIGSGRSSA